MITKRTERKKIEWKCKIYLILEKKMENEERKVIFETMLMSDLHLEYSNNQIPEFDVNASNLILAGDIGRPDIDSLEKYLLKQSSKFENIF